MVAWFPGYLPVYCMIYIYIFYTARFDENLPVSAQDLQNYGLSLIQKEDPNFKASSGWALRYTIKFLLNEACLSYRGTGQNKLSK